MQAYENLFYDDLVFQLEPSNTSGCRLKYCALYMCVVEIADQIFRVNYWNLKSNAQLLQKFFDVALFFGWREWLVTDKWRVVCNFEIQCSNVLFGGVLMHFNVEVCGQCDLWMFVQCEAISVTELCRWSVLISYCVFSRGMQAVIHFACDAEFK